MPSKLSPSRLLATLAALLPALALPLASQAADEGLRVATFSKNSAGWSGPGGIGGASFINKKSGNTAPSLQTKFEDFGITFSEQKASWTGDLKTGKAFEIGLDVNVHDIVFFHDSVTRDLAVEFRDYDNPADGYPYTSVWYIVGTLNPANKGWQHYSVTVADPAATTLPQGWGGYGAEDPVTYEPKLPPGRTFANVIAGADEIVFTTLIPGWVYGFTYFNVGVDNLFIRQITPQ